VLLVSQGQGTGRYNRLIHLDTSNPESVTYTEVGEGWGGHVDGTDPSLIKFRKLQNVRAPALYLHGAVR
jgi:hypothetical protein